MKEKMINETRFSIVLGDITIQDTEAIVNAANSSLMGGGGVDGAIHRAGGPQILAECKEIIKKIKMLPAGEAVITTGGNLKARYVIHTVGPIWQGGNKEEDLILKRAYKNCMELALAEKIKSLSFPSISTGAYHFPIGKAARIALGTIKEFVQKNSGFTEIRMVLYSQSDFDIYSRILHN